jgi:hypothetical protein
MKYPCWLNPREEEAEECFRLKSLPPIPDNLFKDNFKHGKKLRSSSKNRCNEVGD